MSLRRFGIVLAVALGIGILAGAVDRFLIDIDASIWAALAAVIMAVALACETPGPKKKREDPRPPT